MTGWLIGGFLAAGVLLAILADIASSLHAIARHMGASRSTTHAFGVPSKEDTLTTGRGSE